jgi:hypothetical protein
VYLTSIAAGVALRRATVVVGIAAVPHGIEKEIAET